SASSLEQQPSSGFTAGANRPATAKVIITHWPKSVKPKMTAKIQLFSLKKPIQATKNSLIQSSFLVNIFVLFN
ncbi:MAG: hypothetical protein PHT52_02835, partial [Eubacteriales bacterium]|nr:hypothetical protein [Eubacteriales bacterium]